MSWTIFFDALLSWIPRLRVCRSTHRGLKFKRKGKIQRIDPGWYVYVPICTDVELLPVVAQPVRLPFQALMCGGNRSKPVHVRVTLVYEIEDIEQALGGTWSLDEIVADCGAAAVVGVVQSRSVETFRKEMLREVRTELTRETRKALRPYGVRVRWCRATDYVAGPAYRMIGDGESVLPDEEEEV